MLEVKRFLFLLGNLEAHLDNKKIVEWLIQNEVSNEQLKRLKDLLMEFRQIFFKN